MKVRLTTHAVEQLKRRQNLNKEEAYRFSIKAWDCGKKVKDLSGADREYLKSKEPNYEGKTTVRFYKGFKFIFLDDGLLITAYPKHFNSKDRRHDLKLDRAYRDFIANYECISAI